MRRLRAKVFTNGGSQAVRLPKPFRVDAKEVEIWRDGDDLRLRPVRATGFSSWDEMFEAIDRLKPDFPERDQPPMPEDNRVYFNEDRESKKQS